MSVEKGEKARYKCAQCIIGSEAASRRDVNKTHIYVMLLRSAAVCTRVTDRVRRPSRLLPGER